MRRIVRLLFVLAFAACAAQSAGTTRELVDARAAYARAVESNAASEAPRSLQQARIALDAAEEENRIDPGSARERNFAYLALRRAHAAIADANARIAQRDAVAARETLREKTAQTARALDSARAEADSERARADAAAEQAQTEAAQRRAAEQAAATARMSFEQAEAELADIRRQLAAAGNRLDEQTRQLRTREATLSAQVDTLRAERDRAERDKSQAQRERDEALAAIEQLGEVTERDRTLVLTLPGEVMFRVGQAALLPRAKQKLDQLAEAMLSLGTDQTFVVEGHTDARGSAASNLRLSRLRALAVRSYLVKRGVDADRIRAIGRGEHVPVASNSDPEGRANNRRVEIVVTPSAVSRR
jgi:outer membrane protein OmpA-like peptidoglycan-associated protein